MTALPLQSRRILVVKDEYFLADELEIELETAGALVVGRVGGLPQALALLEATQHIDGAIIDLNLRGEMVFPAAEILQERGVPILFVSGYDAAAIPSRFENTPLYQKPASSRQIIAALIQVLKPA